MTGVQTCALPISPCGWAPDTAGIRLMPSEVISADGNCISGIAMPVSLPYIASEFCVNKANRCGIKMFSIVVNKDEVTLVNVSGAAMFAIFL